MACQVCRCGAVFNRIATDGYSQYQSINCMYSNQLPGLFCGSNERKMQILVCSAGSEKGGLGQIKTGGMTTSKIY